MRLQRPQPVSLFELLPRVAELLRHAGCTFALAGGLAANLYRRDIRATQDIDLMILAGGGEVEVALEVLRQLGLKGSLATQGQLSRRPGMGKKAPWMLVGERRGREPSVDFLLPALPWFSCAMGRAQQNLKAIGSLQIPCITAEDVIIAKAFALYVWGERRSDLQDIEDILENHSELDVDYLGGAIRDLGVVLPKRLKPLLPKPLRTLTRARKLL